MHAIGVGFVMATFCDIRVASEEAFFAVPEIDRGVMAAGGSFFTRINMPAGAQPTVMPAAIHSSRARLHRMHDRSVNGSTTCTFRVRAASRNCAYASTLSPATAIRSAQ